jgi:transcriptional regulator with XRE-family HTH domain/predicted nucleotidyltransferase
MKLDTAKIKELMRSQGLSQARLAQESSITRGRINSLLQSNPAEVREQTLRKLARALKVSVDDLGIDARSNGYKQFLSRRNGYLDFRGFSSTEIRPVALDRLFVPVRARTLGRRPGIQDACEDREAARPPGGDTDRDGELMATESSLVACLGRYDRIYLEGEPGSGKTTWLKYIALQYAGGGAGQFSRDRAPLLVQLAEYEKAMDRESIRNPIEFVAAQARYDGCEGVDELLESELRNGRCTVLFDGLDEVVAGEKVVESVREFINDYPRNTFVLTSRIVGSGATSWRDDGFTALRIEDWNDEDIRTFCSKWFRALHDHGADHACADCAAKAERLWQAIRSHPRVNAIATNPLMLSILAKLDHATGVIPRRRVDLYSRVVGVLLETWDASRRVARPGDPLHGMSIEAKEFHWLLGSIGLEMQRKDLRLVPRWWLADFIQDYLHGTLGFTLEESKDQGDRVIRYLGERAGLLIERGTGLYGFSHLTFQEYFASRGIIDESAGGTSQDVASRLRPYLYHPRWGEVVRSVCAQLPPGQSAALIRVILDDPDPVGRFISRGPQLALRCLSDGAVVADRAFASDLLEQLAGLGESRWIGITLDVLGALRGLEGSRFESDARRTIGAILDKASSWMSESDYLSAWHAAHGSLETLMPENTRHWPGDVHDIKIGGRDVKIVCAGKGLWDDSPATWQERVLSIVQDRSVDRGVRRDFIEEIGRSALGNESVRSVLLSLASGDPDAGIRHGAAYALRRAAATTPEIRRLILGRFLERGSSARARQGYGRALVDSASSDAGVREALLTILDDEAEPWEVRAAAADGLTLAARTDGHVRRILAERLRSEETPPRVRQDCAVALREAIGADEAIVELMMMLIDDSKDPKLARIANQAVAEALVAGRIAWDARLVDRVENHLMAVPNPCPNALESLVDLLRTREMRGGLRLDSVLRDYLEPYRDRMRLSFIYGSTARLAQRKDSDIDLFIIGDVRLKEISAALAEAEQILGRPINPVLYSKESFLDKLNERDPFLSQVLNSEKIMLGGFDDELRAVASKSIHPSGAGHGAGSPSIALDRRT